MRLLVCDDHRLLLDALTVALTDKGQTVVATALNPEEAVAAAREHRPDACLLDVNLAHTSGLTAIAGIHEACPDTKVVMLSGSTSTDLVSEAIAHGAQGFVGKDKPIGVIIEALEMAHQGHLAVDPLLLQDLFRPAADKDNPLRALMLLTKREWEVLDFIVDGLSTEQMADQLGVQISTARSHVQNMLTKLGAHTRLQAAALLTTHASVATWPWWLRPHTENQTRPR
jgi:two-component system nitrate/nitrite response regulator NarL